MTSREEQLPRAGLHSDCPCQARTTENLDDLGGKKNSVKMGTWSHCGYCLCHLLLVVGQGQGVLGMEPGVSLLGRDQGFRHAATELHCQLLLFCFVLTRYFVPGAVLSSFTH